MRGAEVTRWSGVMKKKTRGKNPHAVALGRLGGLVRSEAKKRANKENGARAVWSKAARRPSRCAAMLAGHGPGVARKFECGDGADPRSLRVSRHRPR